jgi:hypothetical protein
MRAEVSGIGWRFMVLNSFPSEGKEFGLFSLPNSPFDPNPSGDGVGSVYGLANNPMLQT